MLRQNSMDEEGDDCELMICEYEIDSEEDYLDGFIVRDNFVEYMDDENDHFLDDDEEDTDLIPPLPKRKRLIRAMPETDDEDNVPIRK